MLVDYVRDTAQMTKARGWVIVQTRNGSDQQKLPDSVRIHRVGVDGMGSGTFVL